MPTQPMLTLEDAAEASKKAQTMLTHNNQNELINGDDEVG